MTDAWVNDYVGLPYQPNGRDRFGLDCWGLVLLVFREQRGLILPDWQMDADLAPPLLTVVRMIEAKRADFVSAGLAERIDAAEPWAIVIAERKLRPHHAGICVGRYVLHASDAGVVCPPAAQFNSEYSERSYWRWLA